MHTACAQIPESAAYTQVEANPEKTTAVIAVGTLQNLAAESNANKEAIREAGGIPILVSLIKRCPDSSVRHLPSDMHLLCQHCREQREPRAS